MQVDWITHPSSLEHDPGAGHPECPARLRAIAQGLAAAGLHERVEHVAAPDVADDALLAVHEAAHVERVLQSAGRPTVFDADTATSAGSVTAARHAAGGAVAAVDRVLAAPARTAFAALRPPGHHAERDRAMGFCLFNNVAVAAAHALAHHGLERVLVFDPDVHHGNGTQHIFDAEPRVTYVSIHQWPLYPGTGAVDEVGQGAGRGTTVNVPLPGGMGDAAYAAAARFVADAVLAPFAPQLLLCSAGFDAHVRDPLAGMQLSSLGFLQTYAPLLRWAWDRQVPVAFVLEGGYDLQALADVVPRLGGMLLDEALPAPPNVPVPAAAERAIAAARAAHEAACT